MDRCLRRALHLPRILLFTMAMALAAAAQNTIHVPEDQLTIQDAINAANNGDTILVAPGTYAANLDFLGKAITITSSGGAQNTILDGDRKGPAVQFVTGETQGSVLDGFTITRGFSINGTGAAITINNAAPTIRNNIITDNAGCTTSAVYAVNSSPQLIDNTISNNGQTWTNCSSYGYGAGVYVLYSLPGVQTQIIGNTIVNNVLPGGSGGGLSLFQAGNAVIRNNLIKGNSSGGTGGMDIWNYSSETVVDNVIVENYSTGGGISALYIIGMPNQPGMYLANNTLVGAAQDQVILQLDYFFDGVQLANNIIVGTGALAPVYCMPIYGSAPSTFVNNDVYAAGSAPPYSGVCTDQTGVNGNLSVDPAFLDPAHSDYHLQARSPMVDAGSNSAADLPDKDKDGNPRIVDGNNDGNPVVDIGAFEFVPQSYGQNAVLSPTLAQFPNQDINTTSTPIMLTLTNTGTTDLAIGGISTSGAFAETDNCAQVLPVGAHCILAVTFSPRLGGRISGSLTVSTGTGPVSAALLGTGNSAAARLSPSQINFYDVLLGYSYVQSLTLSSTGTTPLIINSIETSNPFSVIGGACTVGMSLAPGKACDIQVQFTPAQAIAYTGGIIVSTTAPDPLSSTFSGSGAAPVATVSPTALSFSPQLVGTSSAAQAVTFSNTGNSLLTISQISISAPFSQTNNCGSYVLAGSSCTILVTYSPLLLQADSGALVVTHNATGGFSTVPLSGIGIGPVLSLNGTSLSFSPQLVGTTSVPQVVIVSNTGETPLSITTIVTSGPFSETNNCPPSLPAGSSCTVQVTFSPITGGAATGSVEVSAMAPSGVSSTVFLNGNGIGPVLSVSPSTLSFSRQLVGTTSAPQSLMVSNTGGAPLSLTTITTSGPFSETNNCPSSLDPGSSCTLQVAFSPVAVGTTTGTVLVSVPLPTGPKTINLSGTGFIEIQNGIHVPADQPTIQSAINVATAGDTVVVAPGTYFEHIKFTGKPITVTSSDGAATTIIDGGNVGSVVTFDQNESTNTVLNGFTIQNGHAYLGAGISISYASPRITNNVITNNGGISGIGIDVDNGSPIIQGNTITNNVQNMGSGGGGAIHISSSASTPSNVTVLNNVITNNQLNAGANGGGIDIEYFSSALIQNNYISGNSVYNYGGGIHARANGSVTIVDNIITNNTSHGGGDGGGFSNWNSGPLLFLNNTLYGNASTVSGTSEIFTQAYGSNSFKNNIIYATSGNAISCPGLGSLLATNNTVYTVGTATNGNCTAFAESNGNLVRDPLFRDAVSGDFHLQPGSPAIDSGDVTVPALPPQDFSGAARLADDSGQCNFTIDMGVYESHPAAPGSVSISSTSLTFPDTAVGSASAPFPLLLTGTGQGCFRVTGFNLTGDFTQTNACGAGVPAGQSCTVQVSFAPTAAGLRTGTLAVPMSTNMGAPPNPVILSGNGLVPHGTASPSPLNFPGQNVHTTSTPLTVTLTNDGGVSLAVSSVSVTGEFAQTNNCNTPIAPGASCSIQITFMPTINGQRFGTLSIASNSSPSISNVTLHGLGLGPEGSFSAPLGLNFYQQVVNTSSAPLSATLTNTGALPMNITGFNFDSTYGTDFAQTNNCPATLAAGAACTVQVTFTPATSGWRQGFLLVSSDASPFYLITNGYGATNVAQWMASPGAVSFGDVLVTQTGSQIVTLTNNGTATLTISSVVASSPFAASGCVGSFDPGTSCAITVSWTPQTTGIQNGTLTINSNAVNAIQSLAVTGRGVRPVLSYSPTTLTFATQNVGTTSTAQSITLSNTGTGAYALSQIGISTPDFSQTNNCPTSIAPSTSCTINVVFNPTAGGSLSAVLAASGSPAGIGGSVALSGIGRVPAPVPSVSPSSLTFASQLLGTTSAAQAVTLANTGDAALAISSIQTYAPFAQTNNCGNSLAAGATCTINVTFAPTSRGAASGSTTVNVGAPATNQTVALSGTGIAPVASLSSPSLTFPLQRLGSTSSAQVVTLSNTGDAGLTIASVAASSGNFAQSNSCPGALAPGVSCSINISFQPVQSGPSQGSVVITDNSTGTGSSTQTISLSGTGGASSANVSPTSLAFSTTKVGASAAPMSVTLSNSGTMALNITSISASGDFSQSNNCGPLVAPAASCVISIVFTPIATGQRSGALTISDDAQSGPVQTASLSGTGAVPTASVAPGTLTFGTLPAGTQSTTTAVTLSNTRVVAMNISSIATTGDFAQTNNCPTTLSAGSSCTISVIFSPSAGGTRSGLLTITDDASGGSQTVSLSGSATDFSVAVSPTSVSINAGQSANYNSKVSAVGGVYNQSVSLTCAGLPAAATCSFTPVSVIPGSSSQTSKLKITTSTGGTPKGTYTIVVSGVVNNVVRSGTATLIVK